MVDRSFIQCDPFSGREIIHAAHRHDRPQVAGAGSETACPFCPGHEAKLPDILWEQDDDNTWQTRAVSNLYPIVSPPDGHHEIIIDTPEHILPVGAMNTENWDSILVAYSSRLRSLSRRWSYVSLFRNVGVKAGGSIEHPHSQLIALAQAPEQVEARIQILHRTHQATGHCLLCNEMQTDEFPDNIVTQNSGYVAFAPKVSEVPFEIRIAPLLHSSQFLMAEPAGRSALAEILSDTFNRMTALLGEFDHNMMLVDASRDPQPYLHWFLRIRPIGEPVGGFERLTGISVNDSRPGEDAAKLRHAFAIPDMDSV